MEWRLSTTMMTTMTTKRSMRRRTEVWSHKTRVCTQRRRERKGENGSHTYQRVTSNLCFGAGLVIDLTDSVDELQRKFKKALAEKRGEERRKQVLEALFTGADWKALKAIMITEKCSVDAFLSRAQEELTHGADAASIEIPPSSPICVHVVDDDEGTEDEEVLVDSRFVNCIANLLN